MTERVKIISHRGSGAENTMAAFQNALAEGADGIECDVAFTSDHEPVVIHPKRFNSSDISHLVGRRANLTQIEWNELRDMRLSGQSIPHLTEVLDYIADKPVDCYFDPKADSLPLIDKIITEIEKRNLTERVKIIAWAGRGVLRQVKKKSSHVETMAYTYFPFRDLIRVCQKAQADQVCLYWENINPIRIMDVFWPLKKNVSRAQRQGIDVFGGIANTKSDIDWLLRLGVNGIFTDDILLAKKPATEPILGNVEAAI